MIKLKYILFSFCIWFVLSFWYSDYKTFCTFCMALSNLSTETGILQWPVSVQYVTDNSLSVTGLLWSVCRERQEEEERQRLGIEKKDSDEEDIVNGDPFKPLDVNELKKKVECIIIGGNTSILIHISYIWICVMIHRWLAGRLSEPLSVHLPQTSLANFKLSSFLPSVFSITIDIQESVCFDFYFYCLLMTLQFYTNLYLDLHSKLQTYRKKERTASTLVLLQSLQSIRMECGMLFKMNLM